MKKEKELIEDMKGVKILDIVELIILMFQTQVDRINEQHPDLTAELVNISKFRREALEKVGDVMVYEKDEIKKALSTQSRKIKQLEKVNADILRDYNIENIKLKQEIKELKGFKTEYLKKR